MGLVGGVAVVNAALLAVGYALLAPFLRTQRRRAWPSYAGVALLVGAGAVFVVLCVAAVAGAHTGLAAFAGAAGALFAAGVVVTLVAGRARGAPADSDRVVARERAVGDVVATVCATGVAIVVGAAVVGGFRTTPWLDDSWFMWLAKGMALDRFGLDVHQFTSGHGFVSFTSPGYPWWWSILGNADVRAVGSVDLRALDAQLALLFAAFVGAAARMLWGRVRPSLLWGSLLLLVAAPELLRETQSGGADLPLALYLAAAAIAAACWLRDGGRLFLALVAVFGAAAVQIKDEGLPELAIAVVVFGAFAWTTAGARRVVALWGAAAAGAAAAVPWLVWRSVHGVPSEISLGDGLHRLAAFDQRSRLHPVVSTLLRDVFSPRQWLVLVALALALSVAAAVAARRVAPLAVLAFVAVELAFWIWVYWSAPGDLSYRLTTSAYRVVAGPLLVSAAMLPLLAELIASSAEQRWKAGQLRRRASVRAAREETVS